MRKRAPPDQAALAGERQRDGSALAVLSKSTLAAHDAQTRADAAIVRQSEVLAARGDLDAALAHLAPFVRAPLTAVRRHAVQAYAALACAGRRTEEGLSALAVLDDVDPAGAASATRLMLRAQLLRQGGHVAGAVDVARRSVSSCHAAEPALVLCACLRDAGALVEAATVAALALDRAVDDAERAAALAQVAAVAAHLDDAQAARAALAALEALVADNDVAAFHLQRAHAHAALGGLAVAAVAVARARALDAQLSAAWLADDPALAAAVP